MCGFYTRYLEVRPTGLPTPGQQAALAPWLSDSLEARLDAARRVQAQFRAENPGDKPPLVDGCLFASLFEGPTAFTVGTAIPGGGTTRVPVQFRYGTEAAWQDVVVLVREGPAYVIDDIEFAGRGAVQSARPAQRGARQGGRVGQAGAGWRPHRLRHTRQQTPLPLFHPGSGPRPSGLGGTRGVRRMGRVAHMGRAHGDSRHQTPSGHVLGGATRSEEAGHRTAHLRDLHHYLHPFAFYDSL